MEGIVERKKPAADSTLNTSQENLPVTVTRAS
jgi:hypothetical protein